MHYFLVKIRKLGHTFSLELLLRTVCFTSNRMGIEIILEERAIHQIVDAVLAAIVGHLVLDFLDDGNEMVYPIIKGDLGYSIISKASPVVWAAALVAIVVGFAIKKVRLLAIIGVSIIILYCGFQATSKVVVTTALKEQYPIPAATIIFIQKVSGRGKIEFGATI